MGQTNATTSRRLSIVSNHQHSTAYIDAVGPPKILQYKPETTKKVPDARSVSSSSSTMSIDSETMKDMNGFMTDFNVYINGEHECEFCGAQTKPWPTIKDQENCSNINEVDIKANNLLSLIFVCFCCC